MNKWTLITGRGFEFVTRNITSHAVKIKMESHSVREYAELGFSYVGLDYNEHVVVDQELFRPAEVNTLTGDATKAKNILKWEYQCSFPDLVRKMIDSDIEYYSEHKTEKSRINSRRQVQP